MNKWFNYIALVLCMASCIYPYDIELDNAEAEKVLVVDGEIITGGISTIRLSYMSPLNTTSSVVYDGGYRVPQGFAWIEDETGKRYEATLSGNTSPKPSNYFSFSSTEAAGMGHQYRAVIEVDGQTYVSDWQEPTPGPKITDVYFEADDQNVLVFVNLETLPDAESSGFLNLTYDETWEFHSEYPAQIFINTETWEYEASMSDYPFYWCWRSASSPQRILVNYSNLDGNKIQRYPLLSFPRVNNRNHKKYSINVKAGSLSRETFTYQEQTQKQSQSGSDLFSPDPGALKGNLTCETDPEKQVMGMVLVGDLSTKRAWLDDRYLLPSVPHASLFDVPEMEDRAKYYDLGYRPIANIWVDDVQVVGWGPERCINCIKDGGTQTMPDFWRD